jgi:hypothetical protein
MECCPKINVQSLMWNGLGVGAAIIGDDYKFYRAGNPPINTGTMDTPGRKFDSGKSFDPVTGVYDQGDQSLDGGRDFDPTTDPDTFDQTKFDAAGAAFDDSLAWDQPGNLLFTLPVSLNAEDMTYKRPNKYGKATWYAVVDGTDLQVGLYFIGPGGTFFIAAMQKLLPILAVQCNRTVAIIRPFAETGVGIAGYGGNTEQNQTVVVTARPCSILQGTKGEKGDANLPGDTRSPWWNVLMPYADTEIRPDDILVDDLSNRYTVSSCESTPLGYRMTCMQDLT